MSRIFLLGNGKSLLDTPLDLLKSEATMGVNKIASIFDPMYYVKIDYSAWEKDQWMYEVFPQVVTGKPCLLWDVFRDGVQKDGAPFSDNIPKGIGNYPNVTWATRCEHHGNKGNEGFWHEPYCTAWNSIVPMVQWAEKLGFTEIYLVGCDGVFTDGIDDHFMPYYKEIDLNYRTRNNHCVQKAHEMIAKNCKTPIYNCTVGGIIENYPRISLKEVLSA